MGKFGLLNEINVFDTSPFVAKKQMGDIESQNNDKLHEKNPTVIFLIRNMPTLAYFCDNHIQKWKENISFSSTVKII